MKRYCPIFFMFFWCVIQSRGADKPPNVVFILVDDMRFDAFSFMGHPFLKTPNMDRLAHEGVHCKNAFVTTALCSPSRASILTGLYAHSHGVVDNNNPVRDDLVFFPQLLQKAGYDTAFIGKWHMGGETDEPQRGFGHWISFRGQGQYHTKDPRALNIDGQRSPQPGYLTDDLTDFATEWISKRTDKPFFLYLSHKAVHADFVPAERHQGRYEHQEIKLPASHPDVSKEYTHKPKWVKDQRNSWHGVDYPYHSGLDIKGYYRSYCEALLAVDDSVGRVVAQLERIGVLDSTLVVVMGDNGFMFGEHGLIDKRNAYEESMRVPLVMRFPAQFKAGTKISQIIANIDIAPTLLEVAGLPALPGMQGTSFLPLVRGEDMAWRKTILYEYYWERNFPQTPTMHAIRGDRFKYIRYQGIWDIDELYDLESDSAERINLINQPEHQETVSRMNQQLFKMLADTDGLKIPLLQDRGEPLNKRRSTGSSPGDYHPNLID